jgi:hypothetical protein
MAQDRKKGVSPGGAVLAFAFILAAITALYLGEWNASRGEQKQSLAELPALTHGLAGQERLYELAGKREYDQPSRPRLSMDVVIMPPLTRERVTDALLEAEADARTLYPHVTALLLFAFPSSLAQRQGARPIASLEWAADRRGFDGGRPAKDERRISVEEALLR